MRVFCKLLHTFFKIISVESLTMTLGSVEGHYFLVDRVLLLSLFHLFGTKCGCFPGFSQNIFRHLFYFSITELYFLLDKFQFYHYVTKCFAIK